MAARQKNIFLMKFKFKSESKPSLSIAHARTPRAIGPGHFTNETRTKLIFLRERDGIGLGAGLPKLLV